jgi:hypothetical protein
VNLKVYTQLSMLAPVDTLRKLDSWFNPQARTAVEDYKEGRKITLGQANMALFSIEIIKQPKHYNETLNCSENFRLQNFSGT